MTEKNLPEKSLPGEMFEALLNTLHTYSEIYRNVFGNTEVHPCSEAAEAKWILETHIFKLILGLPGGQIK